MKKIDCMATTFFLLISMTTYAGLPKNLIDAIINDVNEDKYAEELNECRFFPVLLESTSEETPAEIIHLKSVLWLKKQRYMIPTFLYTKVVVTPYPYR